MDKSSIDKIMARVRELLEAEASSGRPIRTIDDWDTVSYDLREKLGHAVAEELAEGLKSGNDESAPEQEQKCSSIRCSCGRKARFKGSRSRDLVSRTGVVALARRYYYCRRCDRGFCPLDARLGLRGTSYSSAVEQHVAKISSLLPYESAVAMLEGLTGISVSASHAQTIVDTAGRIVDRWYEARRAQALDDDDFVSSAKPLILYQEVDGVHAPIIGGWREMRIGVSFEVDTKGRRVNKRYCCHLGDAETFADQHWYPMAVHAGVRQAKLVVVLGDGAHWIWNQAELNFPTALQILDFWHATERLWTIGKAAWGLDSTAAADWVQAAKEDMHNSNFGGLMERLARIKHEIPSVASIVDETETYYLNNKDRMDYARYRAMGLYIGSGAVESACKQVVTQRLKGAGMRWTSAAAQTIANLRCLSLSKQWDNVTSQWSSQSPAFI